MGQNERVFPRWELRLQLKPRDQSGTFLLFFFLLSLQQLIIQLSVSLEPEEPRCQEPRAKNTLMRTRDVAL